MNAIHAVNAINKTGSVAARFNPRARCGVCGFSEVRTDEVVDRGVLFLAECPRCDHRWTSSEPIAAATTAAPSLAVRLQRVPARFSREVQPAA